MKNFLSLLALCCFGTLSAQTTVLTEDFGSGIVPPAGWITQNLNGSTTFTESWNTDIPYGFLRAWHGDGGSADGQAENILATPAMDLTGMTEAYFHMDIETNYVAYMAHSNPSYGNGATTVEVSTDGGATWTVVWTDSIDASEEDLVMARTADMSAYAGQANVMAGIHFSGDWAHEVWVDNVVVDDQPGGGGPGPGVTFSITPMTAGSPVTFSIADAAPNSNCIIGYSLTGAGPTNTAFGVVDMSRPISTLANISTNASGAASLTVNVPANASGVTLYTQALNLAGAAGVLTNSLAETVQ